jgi:acyl-coenzyme A synthetase/AMP-(fatty) acid ligase
MTLLERLGSVARAAPDAVAWEEGGLHATFGDVLRAVVEAAGALRAGGPVEGQVLVVDGVTGLDVLVGALAVRRAGAVPLTLAPGTASPLPAAGHVRVEQGRVASVSAGSAAAGEAAWIRATSGSSGLSRAIAFDEAQAEWSAERAAAQLGDRPRTAVVGTVPPTGGYGWNALVWAGWLRGCRVVLVPPTSPRGLLEAATAHDAAWLVTTPTLVRALARLPDVRARPSLRVLVSGDAFPTEAAATLLRRTGIAVLERYGATEAGVVAQAIEPGGALRAVPDVRVTASGDPSTLAIRSPGVGLGVLDPSGALTRFHGAIATSDVVRFEGEGGFRVLRRADRVVKRAGRFVDLARVEAALVALPGVRLARIDVVPTALDVDLVAHVVPRAGTVLDPAAISAGLAGRLEPWERPVRVEVSAAESAHGKWTAAPEDGA